VYVLLTARVLEKNFFKYVPACLTNILQMLLSVIFFVEILPTDIYLVCNSEETKEFLALINNGGRSGPK